MRKILASNEHCIIIRRNIQTICIGSHITFFASIIVYLSHLEFKIAQTPVHKFFRLHVVCVLSNESEVIFILICRCLQIYALFLYYTYICKGFKNQAYFQIFLAVHIEKLRKLMSTCLKLY